MIAVPVPGRRGRPDAATVARLCHALSDETRLAVLERLQNGEQCVCNLVDLLRTGQSRLSFHMKTLKDAGLVIDRRDGRWIHYSINPAVLELLGEYIASFNRKATQEGTTCCRK